MTGKTAFSERARGAIGQAFNGPALLAFVPAVCLAAFWMGGETALISVSLGIPVLVLMINPAVFQARQPALHSTRSVVSAGDFDILVDDVFTKAKHEGRASALFYLHLSDLEQITQHHGHGAAEKMADRIGDRLEGVLRERDAICRFDTESFAICLSPVQYLDLEACIELCGRIQCAIEDPISVDGAALYTSAAIGFCQLNRAPGATSEAWVEAAAVALEDAKRNGPTSMRAFSAEMHRVVSDRQNLRDQAGQALENGQIQPWFQPQISTDTGRVTGFEALARWNHPDRGIVSPGEFLPALEEAGLLDRLGEVMLYHTLTALKAWDAAGVHVPTAGVNFSGAELSNPRLVERVEWELDRFDLAPERLSVEILETVVSSSPGDTVARNVKALETLGCKIDLDDFGTGNASIAAIRRFNVARIKIDRSFVIKADRDPDQRRMVAAILTMAERLDIETLAEGVETVGEHALLAQLGCGHVQGFGIGRPMPFDKTIDWIVRHEAKLNAPPALPQRKAGER